VDRAVMKLRPESWHLLYFQVNISPRICLTGPVHGPVAAKLAYSVGSGAQVVRQVPDFRS